MSASLVGSEMCIRDREPPSALGWPWCRKSSKATPCGRPPTRRRAHGSSAVSYTHLTLPTICSV
eukprot:11163031-Alexandrium_andersonii.AAC.1